MFEKKAILVNTLMAIATMSMSVGAVAANVNGLFTNENGTVAVVIPDTGDKITVNGNAYINKPQGQNVLWDLTKDLEITGDLGKATNCGSANVTFNAKHVSVDGSTTVDSVAIGQNANFTVGQDLTLNTASIQSGAISTVTGNVKATTITLNMGTLAVGGTVEADTFEVLDGHLSGLNASVLNGVTVDTFKTGASVHNNNGTRTDLEIKNLVVTKSISNYGGALTATGQFGTADNAITLINRSGNGKAVDLTGDAYFHGIVDLTGGSLHVDGTTTLVAKDWTDTFVNVTAGNDKRTEFSTNTLVIDGGAYIKGVDASATDVVVKEKNKGSTNNTVIAGLGDGSVGKLEITNSLTLNGGVNFLQQNPLAELTIPTLVMNQKAEKYALQSVTNMTFDNVVVQKFGRIDKTNTRETENNLTIKNLTVQEKGSFTFSAGNKDSVAVIDNVVLADGAKLTNGYYLETISPDAEDQIHERGGNVTVKQLTGSNVELTSKYGTFTVGSGAGTVKLEGQITDKNNGLTLNLGEKSFWNVTGESSVGNLAMSGGLTNIAETDANVSVAKLTGTGGTVLMDASKKNTITVKEAAKDAEIEILATENADKVTTGQAEAMVDRLAGVDNKSAFVDEGMYQGAITVDRTGHATQAKNDLMADTLELASASTLSLNRILMNDVRKRLGDIRSAEEVNGVWVRYDGGRWSGEGTKNKFNTIHVGGDTMPFAGMPVRVGVVASYTNGDVDYTRGDADLDAYSLAAYGTWMNDNGMFADVIARVAKAESYMTVDSVYKGKLKNMAYSLSGEFGWRFDLNNMFYAEPQVEATYTYIDSDKLTLAGKGETYNYGVESFDSFIGRMGVLAGMKCPNQKGDVYVRASVVHEFLGDATIKGGYGSMIENEGKDTWFEYGIGANFNVGKNTYLWADLERTAGALVDEDIRGTLGVRFGF